MRVAIVADWLTTYGGAEHVLSAMLQTFPSAHLFTTVAGNAMADRYSDHPLTVSYLQKLYAITGNHQVLLTGMPRAIESLDLSAYDIVLSSSHAVGKGVVPSPHSLHVCYCHTPMRYAWEMEEKYLKDFSVPEFLKEPIRHRLQKLRRWDLSTARRVDVFIANSHTIKERIDRTYGRSATVLHPPVEDRFFETALHTSHPKAAFLAVGRLVPYKRFDLLIDTVNKLGIPLNIAGTGQDLKRLQKRAGPTVQFLGYVPDTSLPTLYASAKALLFPQEEDAGIIALEAQACGTPIIALNAGGARDTVKEGITGIFFEEQTTASLADAMHRFESFSFDASAIRAHAEDFRLEPFKTKLRTIVETHAAALRNHTFVRT